MKNTFSKIMAVVMTVVTMGVVLTTNTAQAAVTDVKATFGSVEGTNLYSGSTITSPVIYLSGATAFQYVKITSATGFDYSGAIITASGVTTIGSATGSAIWGGGSGIVTLNASFSSGGYAVLKGFDSIIPTSSGTKVITIELSTNATFGEAADQVAQFAVEVKDTVTTNQITLTARVLPILSMNIAGGSITFGTLTVGSTHTGSTTVTVSTNAVSGFKVYVSNLGLLDGTKEIGNNTGSAIADITTGQIDGKGNYGIQISTGAVNNANSAVLSVPAAFLQTANAYNMMNTSISEIFSSAGAVDGESTVVQYGVNITALQEAGNYSDTVTYTVTGTY